MVVEYVCQIEILDTGKLILILESDGKPDYQHIYREGREVYWNDDKKGFISSVPRKWSYFDWLKHICLVTNDIGVNLLITNATKFTNISNDFEGSIIERFELGKS